MNNISNGKLGRPTIYGERMVQMMATVTPEQKAFLTAWAAERGCGVAEVIREAIEALRDRQSAP